MKTERILTLLILALLALGALLVQTGHLRLGPIAGTVIRTSVNLQVPPLTDPAMIRRGAAYYEIVCATCHASPLSPDRADHLRLTPPAPNLHLRTTDWLPEVLFLTVKHGIPNTAMPAWPARNRDDEVWSMVAFLQALPDLDAATYAALSGRDADTKTAPAPVALCVRCHGSTGRGDASGAFPRLDIQNAAYLLDSLRAYRAGQRQSGFMAGIVGTLDEADMALLADYFAAPQPPPTLPDLPATVTGGGTRPPVAACIACHDPNDVARPAFPRLSGQYPGYLATQLRLFAQDPFTRGGGPFARLMREIAQDLTEAEILAAAIWYGQAGKVLAD